MSDLPLGRPQERGKEVTVRITWQRTYIRVGPMVRLCKWGPARALRFGLCWLYGFLELRWGKYYI